MRFVETRLPDELSRFRGCLLGGAVGDALGAPLEFLSTQEIDARFGRGGPDGYITAYGRTGAITDDTQMTLFTAEGLIRAANRQAERGICDPVEVIRRAYERWLYTQDPKAVRPDPGLSSGPDGWLIEQSFLHHRRAPGNTCLSALYRGGRGRVSDPINDSKGCGGVMRVAPVGLIAREPFDLAADAAALTHGHPSGYLAAGALATIVADLGRGATIAASVVHAGEEAARHDGGAEVASAIDVAIRAADHGPDRDRLVSLGQGWVAEEALAMSVYCALVAADFRSGVLLAVQHGGDSDSTGAITGNILGTAWGVDAIPADLLDGLEGRDVIDRVAHDLFDAAHNAEADWERYPPN
jgi:ADP-ribosyl-[dinitrogen reductase] hydrolase